MYPELYVILRKVGGKWEVMKDHVKLTKGEAQNLLSCLGYGEEDNHYILARYELTYRIAEK